MRAMRAQNLSIRLQEIVSLLLGGNIFSFCVDFNILQYLSITSVVHVMIGHWFHINESTFVRVRCFKGLTEQIIDFTKKMCSGFRVPQYVRFWIRISQKTKCICLYTVLKPLLNSHPQRLVFIPFYFCGNQYHRVLSFIYQTIICLKMI